MAHRAYLSVMGLYQWDNTLFDTMVLPEGLNIETLSANILLECSEMEFLLPDPEIAKRAINYWSQTRSDAWQHMFDAMKEYYNPLWNKDGKITEDITTDTEGIGSVAGFNSNTLNPANKSEGTQKQHYVRVEQGNIGVTTSQAMLTEEIKLRSSYDIYNLITAEFKKRFCLSVY